MQQGLLYYPEGETHLVERTPAERDAALLQEENDRLPRRSKSAPEAKHRGRRTKGKARRNRSPSSSSDSSSTDSSSEDDKGPKRPMLPQQSRIAKRTQDVKPPASSNGMAAALSRSDHLESRYPAPQSAPVTPITLRGDKLQLTKLSGTPKKRTLDPRRKHSVRFEDQVREQDHGEIMTSNSAQRPVIDNSSRSASGAVQQASTNNMSWPTSIAFQNVATATLIDEVFRRLDEKLNAPRGQRLGASSSTAGQDDFLRRVNEIVEVEALRLAQEHDATKAKGYGC